MDNIEKKPLVSVIIPCYNGEKYIRRAVSSVLGQPRADLLEVIVVNDGSKDKSAEMAESLVKEGNGLTVINQENGGVANARNNGMKKAEGKFLAFLDADDWWTQNFFDDELVNLCIDNPDTDTFSFGSVYISMNYKYSKIQLPNKNGEYQLIEEYSENGRGKFNYLQFGTFFYNREKIVENSITFPNSKRGEDIAFAEKYFYYARKIIRINKPMFEYWFNSNSLTRAKVDINTILLQLDAYKELDEWFLKRGEHPFGGYLKYSVVSDKMGMACLGFTYKQFKETIFNNPRFEYLKEYEKAGLLPCHKGKIKEMLEHPFKFWLKSKTVWGLSWGIKSFLESGRLTRNGFLWLTYKVKKHYKESDVPKEYRI